ncbi:related to asparaginyl-tRNA synthetase (mitochondrial) [Rhynchosporium secalis]|uniref:asparagine--tRNA ligase n=1 Tax=Rhynchosporium secalis TaxID=38038 RepID=A0A1E1MNV0_RHYSE|nr:related to asparaginyl-tRNA synthetase (mitochondrial) [Rhynchosporium secalis]
MAMVQPKCRAMRSCRVNLIQARCRRFHTRPAAQSPSIASLLDYGLEDPDKVVVNGLVQSVRKQKQVAFVSLRDGTTAESVQVVIKPKQFESLADLTTGTAARFTGAWTESKSKGQNHELLVKNVKILGPADSTFPLQKKWHTPEYARTIPHLRARTSANSTTLRFRSDAIAAVSGMFQQQGFTQTHTPIITSSDCEGAGEVFHVGSSNKEKSGEGDDGTFFRAPKYLTVSSQLHLEALAQAVGKVWTLSPTFRAEKSDTARHLSEFYMLEAELNYTEDMEEVMDVVQNTVCSITDDLLGGSRVATELLKSGLDKGEDATMNKELIRRWRGGSEEFHRITYTDAIKLLQSSLHQFEHEPKWGNGLQAEHERYVATTIGSTDEAVVPVFVTHYPKAIKPFYMLPSSHNEDGRETVDCFDLLVPEACEIAGGSMREYRLEPLMQAMQANKMIPSGPMPSDADLGDLKWYIDLRRWGSAPHGGFGLGFDRLLGYLGNIPNIREVVTFPRWVGRCDC